ncbi:MAG: PD-(D/E)XK nuclease family protein, partial [Campylobacterota bacterium]|nr:PD-(D/E)XK nuclease family protein [Campylobacterota bacterium]
NILNKNPIDKITQDITISNISSKIEQIAFIKYQITNMINKGISPERIVVVTPNEEFIETLKLFDNEGYFNFAVGMNIKNNKIMQVIKLISKIIIEKEPKDDEKYKFLSLDEVKFNKLFSNNWNKQISKDIFNDILDYLFSLETNIELIEKFEQIRISLDILLFTNIKSGFIKILVKDFIKLLQNKLSTITLDDTRGGKITVLGILETRVVAFDGVIVIDFNDDKIPKISIKDKFISSSLKELVKLPTIKDRENLQRYYYKRFFDKAKSIAISYVDDEQYSMSRFIVQLLPNYKQYLVKQDYSNILYNKKELTHYYNDIIIDIDLSKLSWSATGLKEYLSCKRKFYFNHITSIKEHKVSLKPKGYEVGNIIHKALESAVKQNSFTIEFINKFIGNYQKKNPYLILELERWKKKLVKLINNEELRRKHNISIYDVEENFNLVHNDIKIKGTIDRIDKYPDGTYEILDYKTSSSLKIDNGKNYKDSVDFQLEFYYLALSKDKSIQSVGYYDLNDSSIKPEVMLKEKLEILDTHLKSLKTTKVNFKQTEDIKNCKFCPYSIICDV